MVKNKAPLIYCNGCSYSNNKYHPSLNNSTYADVIGRGYGGFVINRAVNGSCNRRIIRTSLLDLLEQRRLNADQPIFAILGLSFDLRKETWNETASPEFANESNFVSYNFTSEQDWKTRLFSKQDLDPQSQTNLDPKWFGKLSEAQAYFHSPLAERINTFADLIMLHSILKDHQVSLLVFQAPPVERIENEHVLDQLRTQIDTPNFLELETLSFTRWCWEQGYSNLEQKTGVTDCGHPDAAGHRAFAKQVLIPRLEHVLQV